MSEETIEKIEAVLKDTSHSSMRAKAQAIYDAVFSIRKLRHEKFDIDHECITDGFPKYKPRTK